MTSKGFVLLVYCSLLLNVIVVVSSSINVIISIRSE